MEDEGNLLAQVEKFGSSVGRRLLDDFCARYSIYERVDDRKAVQLLKIFLENYIGDTLIDRNTVKFLHPLANYQREIGLKLMAQILGSVFRPMNRIQFYIENQTICFNLESGIISK